MSNYICPVCGEPVHDPVLVRRIDDTGVWIPPCDRSSTGWYCTKDALHSGPCSTLPRWWNLRGRWRMSRIMAA